MTIEIRPIETRDIEGYHHALDLVARERRHLARVEAPPLEATRRFVLASIEEGHVHLVVEDHGAIVGWCDIIPRREPCSQHVGDLGIGLVAGYRGRGIGRVLIQAALEMSDHQGLVRIVLTVYADNVPAIRLYEAVGFEPEGRLEAEAYMDGAYRDALLMARVDRSVTGRR